MQHLRPWLIFGWLVCSCAFFLFFFFLSTDLKQCGFCCCLLWKAKMRVFVFPTGVMGIRLEYVSQLRSLQALFAVPWQAPRDAGGTLLCAAVDRRRGGEDKPWAPRAVPGRACEDHGDGRAAQVNAASLWAASPLRCPCRMGRSQRGGQCCLCLNPIPFILVCLLPYV